jgi:hypothetical protein
MKYVILSFALLFLACTDNNPSDGTVMFTASDNCYIQVFDVEGRRIHKVVWELERPPTVVYFKKQGLYLIDAVTYNGKKTYQKNLTFSGGNVEYYIEF